MTFTHKIAATVLLTLGGLIIWFVMSLFGSLSGVSYAEVAEQIRDAHFMSWTLSAHFANPGPGREAPMKMVYMAPGVLRSEYSGLVTITDVNARKTLTLDRKTKIAELIETKNRPTTQADMEDMAANFRKLADQQGQRIEDRQFGDVKAKGFSVVSDNMPTRLWVDPKTKLPLEIEMDAKFDGKPMTLVLSDIVFDPPLDDSLFSLEPPADYTLKTQSISPNMDIESNVIGLLQIYASKKNGTFPPKLDDWAAFARLGHSDPKTGRLDPDSARLSGYVGTLTALTFNQTRGTDYDYTPGGAKLGDSEKIVFWHHDAKTGHYRAVFGDLHAADVSEDSLPVRK